MSLVSVITPLFNNERFISQTIESVLGQSYPDWEMIIVDDGSTDQSFAIAQRYADHDKRICLLQQQHCGSATARNLGIHHAHGRYIALLDSDDVWESTFLEKQLQLLNQTGGQLVCSAHKRIDGEGKECLPPFFPPKKATYNDLLKTCSISCLTAVYDTHPFGKIYLRDGLRLRDDYVLWLEIIKKTGVVYGNQEILASYRMTDSQKSAHKTKTIIPQYKVYREVEHLGIIKSLYYLTCWAIHGIIKYTK